MRKLRVGLIAAVLASSMVFAVPASAGTNESLCYAVAADNKTKLRSTIRSSKLRVTNVYVDLKCNGINLIQFAFLNSAVKTGEVIIKKVNRTTLRDSGIIQWAIDHNFSDTPLFAVLEARLAD